MKKEFAFEIAQELLDFIEENKEEILRKRVIAFYRDELRGNHTDCPIVFVLEKYSIVIEYIFLSSIWGCVMDTNTFLLDMQNNSWKKYSRSLLTCDNHYFFVNQIVKKIEVGRFSHSYEINAATGEARPNGGDYFGEILITFENDRKLRIVAEDAEFDGWMDIEEVQENEKEHWTKRCGYCDDIVEIL